MDFSSVQYSVQIPMVFDVHFQLIIKQSFVSLFSFSDVWLSRRIFSFGIWIVSSYLNAA